MFYIRIGHKITLSGLSHPSLQLSISQFRSDYYYSGNSWILIQNGAHNIHGNCLIGTRDLTLGEWVLFDILSIKFLQRLYLLKYATATCCHVTLCMFPACFQTLASILKTTRETILPSAYQLMNYDNFLLSPPADTAANLINVTLYQLHYQVQIILHVCCSII